jgi:hypothetical protein
MIKHSLIPWLAGPALLTANALPGDVTIGFIYVVLKFQEL